MGLNEICIPYVATALEFMLFKGLFIKKVSSRISKRSMQYEVVTRLARLQKKLECEFDELAALFLG